MQYPVIQISPGMQPKKIKNFLNHSRVIGIFTDAQQNLFLFWLLTFTNTDYFSVSLFQQLLDAAVSGQAIKPVPYFYSSACPSKLDGPD
ncbi:hypothetical protein [Larkinella harenae]